MLFPVSVIIPCKNIGKFIGKAIQSILNQTYQNFEIIIINDGSTDDSGKVIDEFAKSDNRITHLYLKQSVGLSEALNIGIRLSKHDWIARMDGDDISLPTRLEKQIGYINKYPDLKLVGCLPFYIDENDKIIGKMNLDTFTPEEWRKKISRGKLIFIPGGASMFHKPTILKLGGFSKEFEFIEDLEINMRLALNGHLILNVPEYLYKYRKREPAITADAYRINKKIRWIKERVRSHMTGTHLPTYEEYCLIEESKPFLQRMRILKEDLGSLFFKKFGLSMVKSKPVRAVMFLLCALFVKPSYALHKLRPQLNDMFKKIFFSRY